MHAGPCELSSTCFFFSIGTSQAPILELTLSLHQLSNSQLSGVHLRTFDAS